MSFYLVLFKILDKKETLCQMMLVKKNSRMIGERLRKKCSASRNKKEFSKFDKKHKYLFLVLIIIYLVCLKFFINFSEFLRMPLLSHSPFFYFMINLIKKWDIN